MLIYHWVRGGIVISPGSWQAGWCAWQLRLGFVQGYSAWLLAIAAACIITAQATALAVPTELALAYAPEYLYRRQLLQLRSIAWAWTAGLVYSSVALGYLGYVLMMLTLETSRDFAPFPLTPAMLHVQPALTALLLIYLLAQAQKLDAALIAGLALLPAAVDILFNIFIQLADGFWPASVLLRRQPSEHGLYALMFAVEIAACIWLGFAAARPPRGYTGITST